VASSAVGYVVGDALPRPNSLAGTARVAGPRWRCHIRRGPTHRRPCPSPRRFASAPVRTAVRGRFRRPSERRLLMPLVCPNPGRRRHDS
jgi:hypothetical protein